MKNLDKFTEAYIDALYFTESNEDTGIDEGSELSPEAIEQIKTDCIKFQEIAGELISEDLKQAGHDFWLTRNGHGAGFWDGDWKEYGDKLTAISKQFGEVWVYTGNDGLIYISR